MPSTTPASSRATLAEVTSWPGAKLACSCPAASAARCTAPASWNMRWGSHGTCSISDPCLQPAWPNAAHCRYEQLWGGTLRTGACMSAVSCQPQSAMTPALQDQAAAPGLQVPLRQLGYVPKTGSTRLLRPSPACRSSLARASSLRCRQAGRALVRPASGLEQELCLSWGS